jgi:hypothetical protein
VPPGSDTATTIVDTTATPATGSGPATSGG